MSRKLAHLTPDTLSDLPDPCRTCLFWELDPVRRERAAGCEKLDWVSHVLLEWGSCGKVLYVDDVPVGFAIYAPAAFVPGADSFPTAPVSSDAVLLTTVYVDPAGAGLGRVLIQAVAKDLLRRGGIGAIEAFGGDRDCMVPTEFLQRVGFKTHRAHPVHPRMRLDLRSVLTWREEVESVLGKLIGAVRPSRTPAPDLRDARPAQWPADRPVRSSAVPREAH